MSAIDKMIEWLLKHDTMPLLIKTNAVAVAESYKKSERDEQLNAMFAMLKEFSDTYGVDVKQGMDFFEESDGDAYNRRLFRHSLMAEENDEYLESKNLIDVADALADQMYILVGTILHHKLDDIFFDIFKEVHRSNMSKLENGKVLRREDGKVMKGSSYSPPAIREIIINHFLSSDTTDRHTFAVESTREIL